MELDKSKIVEIKTGYYKIPLNEPLVDSKHGTHTHFELITATVITEDGAEGTGYTYTGGIGGSAIYNMIENDLKPFLIGKDADAVENLWNEMNWHVHYVGRGGIASFAISALDIALWDIRAKKANLPLWKLLGGQKNTVKVYYGGIDLDFPIDKLLDNIKKQIDNGHTAVKIKVGKEFLREDLERVQAVRELLGPEKLFMVDANMKWTVETAIKACIEFEKYDIFWLEEPTIPDDILGYAKIASATSIPIAMGENLHTIYEHRYAIEYGKISFPQLDASNIGGITGWLKVAALAEAFNLPVCTHGMQELHVSLMAACHHAGYMEIHSFPIDQYTKRPLVIKNGTVEAPDIPGVGVEFDWDCIEKYRVI